MGYQLNRRAAFGLGTAVAAGTVIGTPAFAQQEAEIEASPTTADRARRKVRQVYQNKVAEAGGTWNAYISVADEPAVDVGSDDLVEAYSVNKVGASVAVLDKIDRGLLTLDHQIEVPASIVNAAGDGIIPLDRAYPSVFTVGHVLALFLTVSDDTCARLTGLVCPPKEINEILVAKGFPKTQVVQSATNPNRYFLGKTTPRETHDMFQSLVKGTLLSPTSSDFLLNLLRSQVAFTDGIRRVMSSVDRARIATKAGWFDRGRNEAGIMFDTAGKPVLTFALFAMGAEENKDDYGTTHPLVQARSEMGPKFLRAVDKIAGSGARTFRAPAYQPANGG